MVGYGQPLPQQALPQKQEQTSAILNQGTAPLLVETAGSCAGIEDHPLESLALPTHSLTVAQNSVNLCIF